jgi:hypothetical protein
MNEKPEQDFQVDSTRYIDQLILKEEIEQYNSALKSLGLCEKLGINGSYMLYPTKDKQRKWHQNEYMEMVNRLYTVKTRADDIMDGPQRIKTGKSR